MQKFLTTLFNKTRILFARSKASAPTSADCLDINDLIQINSAILACFNTEFRKTLIDGGGESVPLGKLDKAHFSKN